MRSRNKALDYFRRVLRYLPSTLFNTVWKAIRQGGVTSLIDIGCGEGFPLRIIDSDRNLHTVGIDIFAPSIKMAKSKRAHKEYIIADIRYLPVQPKKFDVVLCLEVLEHLKFNEGLRLISEMEKLACEQLIISTVTSLRFINKPLDNPMQMHQSAYSQKFFRKRGYIVFGLANRYDYLARLYNRGPLITLILFILELFDSIFARLFPHRAYDIVCIKRWMYQPTSIQPQEERYEQNCHVEK